jgi:cytochrome P450
MQTEAVLKKSATTRTYRRKTPPGLRYYFPFRFRSDARRGVLQFYTNAAKLGDVVRIQIGFWSIYFFSHPDHIKHILQDNSQNYSKGEVAEFFKPLIGEGLATSEGALWRRQRRLAQPAFHRQRLATFAAIMTDCTVSMLERWRTHTENGQPLDVAAEMARVTFDIVGRTLFSTDISSRADEVRRALTTAREHIIRQANFPLSLAKLPTRRNRRFWQAIHVLDQVVYSIIAERRRERKNTGDLLSMLLLARDEETGEAMSDKHLRDEVITFLLAGHETTAIALTWTWYLLSMHPEVERKLRAELAEVLGGRTPTAKDLPNLKYTRMVIEEALRLYPPGWIMSRNAIGDDEIGGYHIPAKATVVMSQYVTHRHPAFWENPEGFNPERFTPECSAGRPRYAYFPFAGGPRQCIGNEFALMEAQLVVATVAQQYRLHLVPGHPVEPNPVLILRPRDGLMMTLHA